MKGFTFAFEVALALSLFISGLYVMQEYYERKAEHETWWGAEVINYSSSNQPPLLYDQPQRAQR